MSRGIRVLDTSLAPARWNVAMTAALVRRHGDGLAPDTIRFHRYPECVLLGHGQRLADAADTGFCRARGVEIARRVTGGGAVYMTPRMLAFDVVLQHAGVSGLDAVTRRICEAIAQGLGCLGVRTRFEPPNAVAIGPAKVCGTSGYVEGRSAVLQGSLMIEDDTDAMASALRIPLTSLKASVTCLSAALGRVSALAEVQSAMLDGLARGLARLPFRAELDARERALAGALLREEIGSDAFVFGEDAQAPLEAVP